MDQVTHKRVRVWLKTRGRDGTFYRIPFPAALCWKRPIQRPTIYSDDLDAVMGPQGCKRCQRMIRRLARPGR